MAHHMPARPAGASAAAVETANASKMDSLKRLTSALFSENTAIPVPSSEAGGHSLDDEGDDDLDQMLRAAGLLSNDDGGAPGVDSAFGRPARRGSSSGPGHRSRSPPVSASILRDEQVRSYADEFEAEAAAEEIIVGLVPEEDLQRREAELASMREAEAAEHAAKQAEREALVRQKEAEARKRLMKEKASVDSRIAKRAIEATEEVEASRGDVHRTFRQAQEALEQRLREQHAMVKERYGSLVPGRAATRQVKVEWSKLPQPMEIRVHKARAVKNKLPSGRYVLLVTLYDRLGGNPLRWTRLGIAGGGGDASMPAATTPIRHRGRFYDSELSFNQSIFATAPPLTDISPSHVLVFELFVLGGRTQPMDRVVGWTALPCCDRDFSYPSGKFKLPLLRGELDLGVTRYSALEEAYSRDLDTWLCNLYVEVVLMPRMTAETITTTTSANRGKSGSSRSNSRSKKTTVKLTRREYDVELAATSEKLRIRGEFRKPVAFGAVGANANGNSANGAAGLRNRKQGHNRGPSFGNDDLDEHNNEDDGLDDDEDEADEEGSDVDDEDVHSGVKGGAAAWANSAAAGGNGPLAAASTVEGRRAAAAERAQVEAENELLDAAVTSLISPGGGGHRRASSKGGTAGAGTKRAGLQTTAVWRDAEEQEAEDVISKGPSVVREGATRAGVLGLGAVKAVKPEKVPVTTTAPIKSKNASEASSDKAPLLSGGAANVDASPLSASLLAQPFGRGMMGSASVAGAGKPSLHLRTASLTGIAGGASLLGSPLPGPVPSLLSPGNGGAAAVGASGANAASAAAPPISLGAFGYSLTKQEQKGLRGARVRDSLRKLKFLKHELVADLRLGSIRTFDFWIQFILLICALWLRIYIHYLGQWLYLRSLRIPVYEFSPLAYTCTLKYVADVLPNEVEIGEVLVGPLSVTALFLVFCFISWLYQTALGTFPEIPSRFIAYFGIAAVLDPPLIAIVDAIAGRYDCASRYPVCGYDVASPLCQCSVGDAWKLPQRFQQEEGSGVVGILLTVFLYIVIMLISALLLYWYLLHLHLDGRMLDLYRRLHAPEDRFYLPHDFEVSAAELQWIISRARRWRGPRGTTRKVAVCDYVTTDPLDPTFMEVSTHVILYHSSLVNASRELYRQFLRLPDGTLLEVFGSLERLLGSSTGASGGEGGGGANGLKAVLMAHGARKHNEDEDGNDDDDIDNRSAFAGL